jgi:hypothetical protein
MYAHLPRLSSHAEGSEAILASSRFSIFFSFFLALRKKQAVSLKISPSSGLLYGIYGQLNKTDKEEKNNGRRAGTSYKIV